MPFKCTLNVVTFSSKPLAVPACCHQAVSNDEKIYLYHVIFKTLKETEIFQKMHHKSQMQSTSHLSRNKEAFGTSTKYALIPFYFGIVAN